MNIAGFLLGIGTSGTAFGVLMGVVSRATPKRKRSQTVGLVAATGSLGTMILAPLGQGLINGYGWEFAMIGFAANREPDDRIRAADQGSRDRVERRRGPAAAVKAQSLGDALRQALGHRGYLFMTLAFFACGFQLVFITTHLPAYLQLCGIAPG
jgi:hypothetical protein